ncbi:hypothetical protein [Streptomyces roseifaciens]|uniref:hypothetical protein n=1 Tax=Streptomyces roseifaciens TaxID=1488406 RepID=UPI0009A083B5|nr:hypothetical protein [Streptomyces roseifaciens]
MLAEVMAALAAAGGSAVVQAAGTDAWAGFRQRVATWFGRGDLRREYAELERLDQTAATLSAAGTADAERVQIRQEASWEAMFVTLLESLDDAERELAAAQLRALLEEHNATAVGGVSAEASGLAVGGNVNLRADHGSAAALRMGDVTLGNPPQPGPFQG